MGPLLALALLAACVQGATVTVDQSGGKVTASAVRGDKPACVDDLDVVEARDGVGDPAPVAWHIVTADADLCVSRFTLGEMPAGFDQDAPLVPLVPGRRYRVELSGTGFMGATSFTAGPSTAPAPSPTPARR